MRSSLTAAALLAAALAAAALPARANPIYFDFNFSGDGVVGSGQLITAGTPDPAAPNPDAYDVLSIAGTVNGIAITGLVGTVGPVEYSWDGYFVYDNVFYPDGPASPVGAFLDYDGLLFSTADGGTYNLFFDGANYWDWTDQGGGIPVSFFAVDPPPPGVPEPASAAIFGTALLGLWYATRKRAAPRRA